MFVFSLHSLQWHKRDRSRTNGGADQTNQTSSFEHFFLPLPQLTYRGESHKVAMTYILILALNALKLVGINSINIQLVIDYGRAACTTTVEPDDISKLAGKRSYCIWFKTADAEPIQPSLRSSHCPMIKCITTTARVRFYSLTVFFKLQLSPRLPGSKHIPTATQQL